MVIMSGQQLRSEFWKEVAIGAEALALEGTLALLWYGSNALGRFTGSHTARLLQGLALVGGTLVAAEFALYLFEKGHGREPSPPDFFAGKAIVLFGLVHWCGTFGLNIAVHEMGHAVAAFACYRFPDPEILITPFRGGMTSYVEAYGLTSFGNAIGYSGAQFLCTAGGLIASSLCATFEYLGAWQLWDAAPTAALLLALHATSQLVNDLFYGLSTFQGIATAGHDFFDLQMAFSIPPAVAIAALLAIPIGVLTVWGAVTYINRRRQDGTDSTPL